MLLSQCLPREALSVFGNELIDYQQLHMVVFSGLGPIISRLGGLLAFQLSVRLSWSSRSHLAAHYDIEGFQGLWPGLRFLASDLLASIHSLRSCSFLFLPQYRQEFGLPLELRFKEISDAHHRAPLDPASAGDPHWVSLPPRFSFFRTLSDGGVTASSSLPSWALTDLSVRSLRPMGHDDHAARLSRFPVLLQISLDGSGVFQ